MEHVWGAQEAGRPVEAEDRPHSGSGCRDGGQGLSTCLQPCSSGASGAEESPGAPSCVTLLPCAIPDWKHFLISSKENFLKHTCLGQKITDWGCSHCCRIYELRIERTHQPQTQPEQVTPTEALPVPDSSLCLSFDSRTPYRSQADTTAERTADSISCSTPLSVITNRPPPSTANGVTVAAVLSAPGTDSAVEARDRRRYVSTGGSCCFCSEGRAGGWEVFLPVSGKHGFVLQLEFCVLPLGDFWWSC